MIDGTPIDDEHTYNVVTWDFLANGGDDFSKILNGYTDKELPKNYEPITLGNMEIVGIDRNII